MAPELLWGEGRAGGGEAGGGREEEKEEEKEEGVFKKKEKPTEFQPIIPVPADVH
jgi:hypothetical protein